MVIPSRGVPSTSLVARFPLTALSYTVSSPSEFCFYLVIVVAEVIIRWMSVFWETRVGDMDALLIFLLPLGSALGAIPF